MEMKNVLWKSMVVWLFAAQAFAAGHWGLVDSTITRLTDIFFVDPETGWIVTETDTILHTKDGGEIWSVQFSGSEYALSAVQFVDANTGWAVGDLGTVLHTTDGGENWISQNSTLFDMLVSLDFRTKLNGWTVGERGVIANTIDGGATWQATVYPNNETEHQVVTFVDSLHGWVAGGLDEAAHIMRTTDAGVTWSTVLHDTSNGPVKSLYFADTQRGWAGGMGGVILHTTDGGDTWQLQHTGRDGEQVRDMAFFDVQKGWSVGFKGKMLYTETAGAVWDSIATPTMKRVTDIAFPDQNHGWAITSAGSGAGGGKGSGGGGGEEEGENSVRMAYILKWVPEATAVDKYDDTALIEAYTLYDNYPNPFNPSTTIRYTLTGPKESIVSLTVYNQLGQEVRSLVYETQPAGAYTVSWDGTDAAGNRVSSGIYFYRLYGRAIDQCKKMLLLY